MIPYEQYILHDELGNCPKLLSESDRKIIDAGGVKRVGGGCICSTCDKEYYDHPKVLGALWVTRLCNGDLVKL